MKKQSEAKYFCDITKKELKYGPDCELKFQFGYGSELDGLNIVWHFNTNDSEKIFKMLVKQYPILRDTLTPDVIREGIKEKTIRKELKKHE